MIRLLEHALRAWVTSFEGLPRDIWLLSLITLVNRSGTVVIIFLSIYLTGELGFSKEQAGVVIGCFGLGSVLGGWVGGILTDRIGYYRVMFLSLFSVGFFFFGMAYVKEFWAFCGIVVATAAVGDMYSPASNASIAAYSSKDDHPRALSLIRLAINLGFAVGSAAVGFIAGWYGYYWLFVIDGGTCILAAFLFLLVMENKPETTPDSHNAEEIGGGTIRSPYTDVWYILFLICLSLCALPFFQLFTAYPVFVTEEMGFSEAQFGAIMAFNGVLLFFLEMPIIHNLTQRRWEMPSLALGALLIGISFFLFNLFGFYAWVAILAMVFLVLGEILNFPFSNSVALSRSHPSNRGRYMGMFSMNFSFIFIFAPWAGMRVVEIYGYQTLWASMGVACLLSTLGLYLLGRVYRPS